MKKIDFSAIHKSIFLMLFMMMAFVGFSQGTDDFNTATTNDSYTSFTTTGGWSCVNTAVYAQTLTYSMGTCERNYVVINGKTSAVGTINSPELTGGCGSLSFSFGNIFSESNGASFHVTVTGSNSSFDTTVTVANSDMAQGANLLFVADVNIEGDFTIAITNLSPSNNSSKNKDRLAIGCIEWTAYGDVPVVTVAAPTFNPVGGSYFAAQNLTISTATSDAAIYYTLDASDPKTNGILYGDNQVIPINQTTVVKAIAVLGEDTSNVTTATYTLNIPVEVATIAEFKAAEHSDNTIYKITGDVKVLGQYDNKKYTFIQDMGQGTYAALCIYDNNGSNINAYNPGDVISGGVYGTYDLYHNLIEMNPVEGLPSAEGTPGEVIAPDVRTLANVSAYPDWFESKLVTIKGLTFTESRTFGTTSATRGVVAVQGDDTINVYNGWGAITGIEVSEGMTADVTGFISRYDNILEIIPRGSEDIVEVVGPAVAPWTATFEDALENSAWEINNETYSNKWFIGQAQGFDNSKLYISSNNGTTNKYVAVYSFVKASRAIVVPETGGVLSFDYRVNGNNNDYMQVSIVKGGESTTLERLSGANEWTNATYTISPDMAGEATLVFLWTNQAGNANQFPAAIDNVSLMESSCSQPTALQATVEETTATISWTGDAEAYLLQYKLADHSEWYSVNTTENTVVLSDLQGNSNYDVRVQSVCGEASSAWTTKTFAVDCQNYITVPGEKIVGTGNSSTYYAPFNNYYNYSWYECIYPASEFNGSTTINSISWNCASSQERTFSTLKIYMGTRTSETYASTSDWTPESALQLVYDGTDVRVGASTGWQEFTLNTPFEYNGTDNLVVVVAKKGSWSTSLNYFYTSVSNSCLYRGNDSYESYADYPGTNTGTQYNYRANIKLNMMVSSCGDVEACPAVTNVQVDNITPNSAELTWNRGNESETNFKVEYYAEGSTDVQSVLVEDTAYTLSDLAQLTNYTVKVQALCGENNTSEPVEIEFATVGICPAVSDIQSSNAANTTTLTWTPGGEETAWLVQFKPAAAGDNEWISINVNSLPTTTFGGLMATTAYDVRVKALCDPADEENQSEWANHEFTSGCAAIDAPYSQAFDSYNMPDCWEAYGFGFSGGYTYSYDHNSWIMTPAINIPSDETTYLAFDVKGYDNFSVLASYRGTDPSRFVEIYSGTIDNYNNYTQVVIPMTDNLKGRQVYFKIINVSGGDLYVDNLSIDYCPFVPANLTATNITENSAVLTWECAGEVNNFQVKVGENIVDVEGAKTYTLTGLDASTSYTFSVRTQCGEDSYGDWSAEKTFTTACPVTSIPYIEGFEGYAYSSMPDCWDRYSGSPYYEVGIETSSYAHTGNNSLYFENYGSNKLYAVLPEMDEPLNALGIELYAKGYDYDYYYYSNEDASLEVGVVTDINDMAGSFVSWQTITPDWYEYGKYFVDFQNYTGTNGRIAFRVTSGNSYSYTYVYVDDITVMLLPTCGTPSIAVNGTTANITPSTIGEPASYELKIGEETQTVPATETTFTITDVFTDLVYGNTYQMQVRAICGEGDTSEWSAAVDFTYEVAYIMRKGQTQTITTCIGTLYDNGGPQGQYENNSNDVMVIYPASENSVVRLQGEYNTESISYDYLIIYDGENTSAPQLGKFGGQGGIDVTSTTGPLTVYFRSDGSVNYPGFALNISCELLPTCVTPSIASVVPGTTDATVTVAASEHAQSYEVVCVLHGEDIETGTPVAATELTATITGLTPATQYDVYARAICSETDTSNWSDAYSFFTECAAVALPYTENFDSYTSTTSISTSSMPVCWDRKYTGTSTSYGVGIYASSYYSRSGNNSLCFYNYGYGTSASYGDAYAILPEMAENINVLGMELYARKYSSYSSEFVVGVVTDVDNPANSFVSVQTIAPTSTNYEKFVVSFAEYTGANGHIAFRMLKPTSSYAYAYIDDITVDVIPTCGTPTLAVNGTTATITPSTIAGTPASYDLQIGNEIHNVSATETTFTITDVFTDLVYGNTYQMQVRAICGEGDTSAWSAAVDFTYEVAYTMEYGQTREITTCLGTLYDNGGPQSDYQSSSNDVMVIYPASEYSVVRLQGEYNTESISYDYLIIYDGENTSAPQLGKFGGQGGIDVTSTTGPLTVYFRSDGSVNYPGFALNISCKQVVFEKDLAINSIDPIAWACDQSDAKVTINVENTGFADTITSFEARYVINTQAPVSETVNCNLAPGETMSYTFNTTPVFEDGENTVHAIVDMEGDMQAENNYTDPIIVSLLEPETVPYTPTLNAQLVNKGWNVVDANNDGITMDINNAAIVYSFNDTLAANDWMFTPCIEMAAGSYNVYFDYKANSSLTETFEVYYGQGANVDAMTNNIAYLDFNNTDYETAMLTITVAEDGIYNFGFNAMSLEGNLGFSITNFEVYPVVNVTVTSGPNGTVTPNGVVPVNYGENLNLTIVPNTMYHVAGVWVDDVQVMSEDPYNSNFMFYTLENVTEPHNVFVDYKLEYHIIKSVANYNPAYTDVPGEFIPAATDTLLDPNPVPVNFAAAPHYHLYSLEMAMMNEEDMVDVTADVVDNGDHTYSYLTPELVVANYYLRATFRRDTVAVNYLVNTGKGYADQSDVLAQGAQYATWWDYSVANDVDAVANIRPYTTGDAHSDYHIVNVNVNGEDKGVIDTYTFENIQEDQNIAIDFGYQVTTSIRNYLDTYLGSDEVRGTITPDTQLVAEGYPTVVTGTVQEHFHLYNLFVDGVDMINQVEFDGNNYSLTIDSTIANYNIEAVVKIDTFGIHYNVTDGKGYADASNLLVAPADYITWVNYGDDFMMNLAPGRGFSIGEVVVDGIEMYTANNYLFEYVEEHHYVAVSFVPNDYTITTNAYGHGTVTDGMSFTYDPESPVNYQFTATAEEGYHISAIVINDATVDLTGVTDTYTQTLEDVAANYVINAHFAINTYTVDVTAHNGGTTNIQGVVSYNYGENVTVIATADEGHYISSISIDGEVTEYTQDDNRTTYSIDFEAIHENHVVIVDFGVQKFNITATVDADANHGTINYASSFEANLSYGNSITLNFIPEENYQVSDVVVDGQSVGAVDSYEFANITADHNLVVSFAPIQYTLTATSNVDACSINPASTTVQAGSNVNYTLNVATGYHLLNVIANGEEVNVVANAFTIENVQEDYEIFANFAPNNVTVTVAQPAHATITPGTMTYAYGATPSYVIVPEAGYDVTAVHAGNALVNVTYNNGVGSFTLDPVTADITLTATTAIKTFTITVINNAHGTIAPATQTVNYGANVTFTITPEQFYAISDVKVDGASRGAISSYTFNNVTGNHTIEALFEAACYEPTNLTAMDITTTSAVLSWVGTAPSYEVRYRKAADDNWNTQTVTVPTVTLTGLDSNTLYAWEVRAYCTAQLQSEWVANSFMTKAGAQPYDPTSIASAEFNTVKVYSHLNNVYVVNENGVAISSIAIFDINGKQVYTGSVNGSTEVISLNVANGSYIVRLASENGVGIYKVSIVR